MSWHAWDARYRGCQGGMPGMPDALCPWMPCATRTRLEQIYIGSVQYVSMRRVDSVRFLQLLVPTRRILGVAKLPHVSQLGLSISDPYLSFAQPLDRAFNLKDVNYIIKDLDIGGILISRAITGLLDYDDKKENEAYNEQETLYKHLNNTIERGVRRCHVLYNCKCNI